jgi:nucleotide-binding universal stress UspA family protein
MDETHQALTDNKVDTYAEDEDMKILLALDDSECSKQAFEKALADRTMPPKSKFKIVSVVESLVGTYPVSEFYVLSMVEAEREMADERRAMVARYVELLKEKLPDAEVTGEVFVGYPVERILVCSKQWQPDIIILGSHGRRGFQRFILGSVAERVAREATCSVEIIRTATSVDQKEDTKKMTAASA